MLRMCYLCCQRNGYLRRYCNKATWNTAPEQNSSADTNNVGKQENKLNSDQDWKRHSPLFEENRQKRQVTESMIRVDHAGEVGARQIYAGQLAALRDTSIEQVIEEMAKQEKRHMDSFENLILERRIRPTLLMPFWKAAGYSLGLLTGLLGKEAAMACTVAVEEVISQHYNSQIRTILENDWKDEEKLKQLFREFRDEEIEHHDTGIEYRAEAFPFYRLLTQCIKSGCKVAIAISERSEIDIETMKKLVHKLELAVKENTKQRSKYSDDPEKFADSEINLDQAIQEFRVVASVPQLFEELSNLSIWPLFIGLLGHDNMDIVADVVLVLYDICELEGSQESCNCFHKDQERTCGCYERFTLTNTDEANAFYHGLSIIENLLELQPSLSETLANKTNLFSLVTKQLIEDISPSISLYCSELLSVLLQESEENKRLFGEYGLIDVLLQCLAPYRRKLVKDSECIEKIENIFDALCSLLFLSKNKNIFIELQGIELCLRFIQHQQQFRDAALRCLDFAVTNDATVCSRLIEVGGLGIIFALLCEKSKKSSYTLTTQDTEHVVSILYFLFRFGNCTEKSRLRKKFMEHEKLQRLIFLHKKYHQNVKLVTLRFKKSSKETDEEELFLMRLDAGLYTLELIDTILAELATTEEPNLKETVEHILMEENISKQEIYDVLMEFADSLEEKVPQDGQTTKEHSEKQRMTYLAKQFVE
eukprot:jgi/Galph1/5669/GphlegSOOS_G4394.1